MTEYLEMMVTPERTELMVLQESRVRKGRMGLRERPVQLVMMVLMVL